MNEVKYYLPTVIFLTCAPLVTGCITEGRRTELRTAKGVLLRLGGKTDMLGLSADKRGLRALREFEPEATMIHGYSQKWGRSPTRILSKSRDVMRIVKGGQF